jgi:spermidine/putrescine transport system substrate-binding protein
MSDGQEFLDRRLSRQDLLRLAAAAGGAGLLAGRVPAAWGAPDEIAAESGRLQVLDWVGYGYDGGQAMFAAYNKRYPKNKARVTVMTNEANALSKFHAGLKYDLFRPYIGWVKFFAESGLVQPWDPKLITNFKHLNPYMVKGGQYQGKQYGIPNDWGFDQILYRTDKVKPKAKSYGLLFDERYKGKIAWFDDITMPQIAGFYLGYKDTWNQTDAQLKRTKEFLIKKKKLVRLIWSSETTMQEAFAGGDIWISYAWPADYPAMQAKGLKVTYMRPKEKPLTWVGMFMLLKDTPRYRLAHAYVDAWSSVKSGKFLLDTYYYGHANRLAHPSSNALAKALDLSNPKAVVPPYANLDRDIPRRAEYEKLWEEVKAS